jgi:diguanylate cyclase (GGDEF)-like protein
VLLLCWLGFLAAARAQVVLDGRAARVDAWPSATVWAGSQEPDLEEALLRDPDRFAVPRTAAATLGAVPGAVWLRVPLAVRGDGGGDWVLEFQHPVLDRVDVYLAARGRVVEHAALGNQVPRAERPLPGRTHAVALRLQPGDDYLLLARVVTDSTKILPVRLVRPAAFLGDALDEQVLQGLLHGLGIALLLYAAVQAVSLREPLFATYAMVIAGSLLFTLLFLGLGGQYLWAGNAWIDTHLGSLASALSICGSFLFVEQALARPGAGRWFRRMMRGGAAAAAGVALLYAFDAIDSRTAGRCVGALGVLPMVFGLPGALARARRGDGIGICLLVAWLVYGVSIATLVGLVQGAIPVNFWTLHAHQFGTTADMLLFMKVLGLRARALRAEARRMRSLAHSDPLTGLLNRRGLFEALEPVLQRCGPERMAAVYLLDLDGFKPVNDAFGHEAGDVLLVSVALRLRALLRPGDLAARLGGDEFVVVAADLEDTASAQERGTRLLRAFDAPFALPDANAAVGATVGYALATRDGATAAGMIRRADAAMYAGKQAGRNRVRRFEDAPAATPAAGGERLAPPQPGVPAVSDHANYA